MANGIDPITLSDLSKGSPPVSSKSPIIIDPASLGDLSKSSTGVTPSSPDPYRALTPYLDKSYTRYVGKYGHFLGTNYDYRRALNQGTGEEILLGIANLVPNTLLEIGNQLGSAWTFLTEWGDSRDYSNALTEWTQKNKNLFGDIYRKDPTKSVDIHDSAWWVNNATQLIESIGAFYATSMALGGINMGLIGKAAPYLNKLISANNAAKVGFTAADIGRGIAQVGTAFELGYVEGAQIGAEVYKNVYGHQINKGVDPITAKHIAAKSAALTTSINTMLIGVTNISGINAVFKPYSTASKIDNLGLRKSIIEGVRTKGISGAVEAIEHSIDTLATNPAIKKSALYKKLLFESGQEAFEEGVINTGAQWVGEKAGGFTNKSLGETIWTAENLVQAISGALGGFMQTGLLEGTPMHKNEAGKRVTAAQMAYDNEVKSAQQYLTGVLADFKNIASLSTKLSEAKTTEEKDAIRNELFNVKAYRSIIDGASTELIAGLERLKNLDNTTTYAEKYGKEIATLEQELATLQNDSSPEASTRKKEIEGNIASLKEDIAEYGTMTEAMYFGYADSQTDNEYKSRLTETIADVAHLAEVYQGFKNKYSFGESSELARLPEVMFSWYLDIHTNERNLSKLNTAIAEREAYILDKIKTNKNFAEKAAKIKENQEVVGLFLAIQSLTNTLDSIGNAKSQEEKDVLAMREGSPEKTTDENISEIKARLEDLQIQLGYIAEPAQAEKIAKILSNEESKIAELKGLAAERQSLVDQRKKDLANIQSTKGAAAFIKKIQDNQKKLEKEDIDARLDAINKATLEGSDKVYSLSDLEAFTKHPGWTNDTVRQALEAKITKLKAEKEAKDTTINNINNARQSQTETGTTDSGTNEGENNLGTAAGGNQEDVKDKSPVDVITDLTKTFEDYTNKLAKLKANSNTTLAEVKKLYAEIWRAYKPIGNNTYNAIFSEYSKDPANTKEADEYIREFQELSIKFGTLLKEADDYLKTFSTPIVTTTETLTTNATSVVLWDLLNYTDFVSDNGFTIPNDKVELLTELLNAKEGDTVELAIDPDWKDDRVKEFDKNTIPIQVKLNGKKLNIFLNVVYVNKQDGKEDVEAVMHGGITYVPSQAKDVTDVLISNLDVLLTEENWNSIKAFATTPNGTLTPEVTAIFKEVININKEVQDSDIGSAYRHLISLLSYGNNFAITDGIRSQIVDNLNHWKNLLANDILVTTQLRNQFLTNGKLDTTKTVLAKVESRSTPSIIYTESKRLLTDLVNNNDLSKIKLFHRGTGAVTSSILTRIDGEGEPLTKMSDSSYSSLIYIGVEVAPGVIIAGKVNIATISESIYDKDGYQDRLAKYVTDKLDMLSTLLGQEVIDDNSKVEIGIHLSDINTLFLGKNITMFLSKDTETLDRVNRKLIIKYYENGIERTATINYDGNGKKLVINRKPYRDNDFNTQLTTVVKGLKRNANIEDSMLNGKQFQNEDGSFTDPVTNTKYRTYKEYLIKTGALITQVGTVINEEGQVISYANLSRNSVSGVAPLTLKISGTVQTTTQAPTPTPTPAKVLFTDSDSLVKHLGTAFTKFKSILTQAGEHKVVDLSDMTLEEINQLPDFIDDPLPDMNKDATYSHKSKTIYILPKFHTYNKTIQARVYAHELLHKVIFDAVDTLHDEADNGNLTAKRKLNDVDTKLNAFLKSLEDPTLIKGLTANEVSVLNQYLSFARDGNLSEIITYAYTSPEVAKILQKLESKEVSEEGTKQTFWNKLKAIITDIIKAAFGNNKLAELTKILNDTLDLSLLTEVEKTNVVSTDSKTVETNDEIIFITNTDGFNPNKKYGNQQTIYKKAFDIRSDMAVMDKIKTRKPFVTTTIKDGVSYTVVAIKVPDVDRVTLDRTGYVFAVVEQDKSLSEDFLISEAIKSAQALGYSDNKIVAPIQTIIYKDGKVQLPNVQDEINNTPVQITVDNYGNTVTKYIPYSIAEEAHTVKDVINEQSLKQILQRGGYADTELDRLLPNWRDKLVTRFDETSDSFEGDEIDPNDPDIIPNLFIPINNISQETTTPATIINKEIKETKEPAIEKLIESEVTAEEVKEIAKEEGISEDQVTQAIKDEVITQLNSKTETEGKTLLQRIARRIKQIIVGIFITINFLGTTSFNISPHSKALTYDNLTIDNLDSFDDVYMDQESLNKKEGIDIITRVNKNNPDPYLIIDKNTGTAHLFKGDSLVSSYEVGVGAVKGDDQTILRSIFLNSAGHEVSPNEAIIVKDGVSYVKEGYSSRTNWDAGNKSTGAGIYTVASVSTYKGHLAFYMKNERGISVATTLHVVPNAYRRQLISDKNPNNNRISNGCINANLRDLNDLKTKGLSTDHKIYILPDNPNNKFKVVDGELRFVSNENINKTVRPYQSIPITLKASNVNTQGKIFLTSLEDNKQLLMQLYPTVSNDVYNQLTRIAYGIFGQESSFGTYGGMRGQYGRIKDKVATLVTDMDVSVGVTQLRLSSINNKTKETFNISTTEDLDNISTAAVATMSLLLDIYENEIPITAKDKFLKLIPLAYSDRSAFKEAINGNTSAFNHQYLKNVTEFAKAVEIYIGQTYENNIKANNVHSSPFDLFGTDNYILQYKEFYTKYHSSPTKAYAPVNAQRMINTARQNPKYDLLKFELVPIGQAVTIKVSRKVPLVYSEVIDTKVKKGVTELFESNPELANAVYEVLGFNNMITPTDKIVFGHPGIGKTFLRGQRNDFIDVDNDYKVEHTEQKRLREIAKNSGKQEDLVKWESYVATWWNKVKEDAKESNKQIIVSNLPILRMFPQDFDKVITMPNETFIDRSKQRDDYSPNDTEEWKRSLDIEIAKIPVNKVTTTDKYLSDLLITPQQKQQAIKLYSAYLDTIFPDSKVKDIVYHGTIYDFEKFSNSELGKTTNAKSAKQGHFFTNKIKTANFYKNILDKDLNKWSIEELNSFINSNDHKVDELLKDVADIELIIKDLEKLKDVYVNGSYLLNLGNKLNTYFYNNIKNNEDYIIADELNNAILAYNNINNNIDKIINNSIYIQNLIKVQEEDIPDYGKIMAVILNMENPRTHTQLGKFRDILYSKFIDETFSKDNLIGKSYDSAIIYNTNDPTVNDVHIVFKPEQIHILGSKQDIEGFSNFASTHKNVYSTSFEKATIPDFVNENTGFTTEDRLHFNKILAAALVTIKETDENLRLRDILDTPTNSIKQQLIKNLKYAFHTFAFTEQQSNKLGSLIAELEKPNSIVWIDLKNYFNNEYGYKVTDLDDLVDNDGNALTELPHNFDDKAAFTVNRKDTVDNQIKYLINTSFKVDNSITIPDEAKTDHAQLRQLFSNAILRNTSTGLAEPLAFSEIWGYLYSHLHSASTKEEMLNRLYTLGEAYDKSLLGLYLKLANDPNSLNAFFSTFKLQIPDRIAMMVQLAGDRFIGDIEIRNRSVRPATFISDRWTTNILRALQHGKFKHMTMLEIPGRDKKNIDAISTRIAEAMINLGLTIEPINLNMSESKEAKLDRYKTIIQYNLNHYNSTNLLKAANDLYLIPINQIHQYINTYNTEVLLSSDVGKAIMEEVGKKGYSPDLVIAFNNAVSELVSDTLDDTLPAFTEFHRVMQLAETVTPFTYNITDGSTLNIKHNVVYSPQQPSMLSEIIEQLKDPDKAKTYLLSLAAIPSMKYDNWLWNTSLPSTPNGFLDTVDEDRNPLPEPTVNRKYIDRFKHQLIEGVANSFSKEAFEYDEMLGKNYDLLVLYAYMNQIKHKSKDGEPQTGLYPLFNVSDGSQNYLITGSKFALSDEQFKADGSIVSNSFAHRALVNVIMQDIEEALQLADQMFTIEEITDDTGKVTDLKFGVNEQWVKDHKYQLLTPHDWDGTTIIKDGKPTGAVFKLNSMTIINKGKEITILDYFKSLGTPIDVNGVVYRPLLNGKEAKIKEFVNTWITQQSNANFENFKSLRTILKDLMQDKNLAATFFGTEAGFKKVITSFTVNSFINANAQARWWGGSQAEYGTPSSLTKRYTQWLSTGKPLANASGATDPDTFTELNVSDIESSSPELNNIIKILKNSAGFDKTKAADSFSMITLAEAKRRLTKMGRYQVYAKLIEDLEAHKPINPAEYSNFLESLKFTMYDRKISTDLGYSRLVSSRTKNSIGVIIPSLVAGSQLETLQKWMDKNGVGQINFLSAKKVGKGIPITLFDNNGDLVKLTPTFTKQALSSLTARNYTDLKLQQDFRSAILDNNGKIGIQIVKRIWDNVRNSTANYTLNGKSVSGNQLFDEFQDVYSANIIDSAHQLLTELGATFDENGQVAQDDFGNVIIDEDKVREILMDYLVDSDINYTQKLALTKNENGQYNTPIYSPLTADKFISVLSARFTSRIIDQTLPGGHVTVTPQVFGRINGKQNITLDSELDRHIKRQYTKEFLDRGDHRLRVYRNENGEITKLDVLLGAWAKRLFKDGQLVDINELPVEIREMIMYRVPTEGKASIFSVEVVGFIEGGASQVVMPDEVVTISGMDFDFDTIYFFRKHFTSTKKGFKVIEYLDDSNSTVGDRLMAYLNAMLDDRTILSDLDKSSEHAGTKQEISNLFDEGYTTAKEEASKVWDEQSARALLAKDNLKAFKNDLKKIFDYGKEVFKELPLSIRQQYLDTESNIKGKMSGIEKITFYRTMTLALIEAEKITIDNTTFDTKDGVFADTLQELVDIYDSELLNIAQIAPENERIAQLFKDAVNNSKQRFANVWSAFKEDSKAEIKEIWEGYRDYKYEILGNFLGVKRDSFAKWSIAEQNTRKARDNRMIELMLSVMTNPAHLSEMINPNGFDHTSQSAAQLDAITGDVSLDANPYTYGYQRTIREVLLNIRVLKGISLAIDGVNSVISGANFRHDLSVDVELEADKAPSKEKLIAILGKSNVREITKNGKKRYVLTYNTIYNNAAGTGTTIHDRLISIQAAEATANILDAATSYMNPNLNIHTINVWKLLVSLGISNLDEKGEPNQYLYADAYIYQEAIKKYVEEIKSKSIISNQDINTRYAIETVKQEYLIKLYKLLRTKDNNLKIAESQLEKNNTIFFGKMTVDNKFYKAFINFLDSRVQDIFGKEVSFTDVEESYSLDDLYDNLRKEKKYDSLSNKEQIMYLMDQIHILNGFANKSNAGQVISEVVNTLNPDKAKAHPNTLQDYMRNIERITFNLEGFTTDDSEANLELLSDLANANSLAEKYEVTKDSDIVKEGSIFLNGVPLFVAIYPHLFGLNTRSVYPSMEAYLINGHFLNARTINQFFLHKSKPYHDYINEIFTQLRVIKDDRLRTAISNYITAYLTKDVQLYRSPNPTLDSLERERLFGIKEKTYKMIDLSTPDNLIEFNSLSLFNKLYILYSNDQFVEYLNSFNGNHILSLIEVKDNRRDVEQVGFKQIVLNDTQRNHNLITNSINDMWFNSNPYLQSVAKDLIAYVYHTSAFTYTYKGISKYIPENILFDPITGIGYSQLLEKAIQVTKDPTYVIPLSNQRLHQSFWDDVKMNPVGRARYTKAGELNERYPVFIPITKSTNLNGVIRELKSKVDLVVNIRNKTYITVKVEGDKQLYKRYDGAEHIDKNGNPYQYVYYYPISRAMRYEHTDTIVPRFKVDVSEDDYIKRIMMSDSHLTGDVIRKSEGAPVKERNTQSNQTSTAFQGYKGGFEDKGKGTPQGDGKDKAMRQVADGFIGEVKTSPYIKTNKGFELNPNHSSTVTSANIINTKSKNNIGYISGQPMLISVTNRDKFDENIYPKVIMLARNSALAGTPLYFQTRDQIKDMHRAGAEFIVGDMPNVDSQFIDYLQEIGAKFTIYHTGSTSRIKVNEVSPKGIPSNIKGINIFSGSNDPLGRRLTNPNWAAKDLMDVEAPYKANASKIKAPNLNADEALKYDMNLMYKLQVQKFKRNPELIDEINERGGLQFILNSEHIVGVKNSRWEGKGENSNFIKVLAQSYTTVAKELGKFKDRINSPIPTQLSLFENKVQIVPTTGKGISDIIDTIGKETKIGLFVNGTATTPQTTNLYEKANNKFNSLIIGKDIKEAVKSFIQVLTNNTTDTSVFLAGATLEELGSSLSVVTPIANTIVQSLTKGKTNINEIITLGRTGFDEAVIKAAVLHDIPVKVYPPSDQAKEISLRIQNQVYSQPIAEDQLDTLWGIEYSDSQTFAKLKETIAQLYTDIYNLSKIYSDSPGEIPSLVGKMKTMLESNDIAILEQLDNLTLNEILSNLNEFGTKLLDWSLDVTSEYDNVEFTKLIVKEVNGKTEINYEFINKFNRMLNHIREFITIYQNVDLLEPIYKGKDLQSFEEDVNNSINDLRAIGFKNKELFSKFSNIMEKYYLAIVYQYTSNPVLLERWGKKLKESGINDLSPDELRDLITDTFVKNEDISFFAMYLDSIADSGITSVEIMMQQYITNKAAEKDEIRKHHAEFYKTFTSWFGKKPQGNSKEIAAKFIDDFIEKDSTGAPTGRMITRYKMADYWEARRAHEDKIKGYRDQISDLRTVPGNVALIAAIRKQMRKVQDEWQQYHETRTTTLNGENITELIYDKKTRLGERAINRFMRANNIYQDPETHEYYKAIPNEQKYSNPAYYKLVDPNGKPIGKNGEFYLYVTNLMQDLVSFNESLIMYEGFLPVQFDNEKGWEALLKYLAWKEPGRTDDTSFTGIGNSIVHLIELPMLEQIHKPKVAEYPIRPMNAKETQQQYEVNVIEEINAKYGTKFKTREEVRAANAEIKKELKEYHLEHISYDIFSIMNNFITNTVQYKYRKDFQQQIALNQWMLANEIKVMTRNGANKLQLNNIKRKFTHKTEYRSVAASEANVGTSMESWVKNTFYGDKADLDTISKVIKGLTQWSSMRTMMMNMTSATQNLYIGFANVIQVAVGKQFISPHDLVGGMKVFSKDVIIDVLSGSPFASSLDGALAKRFEGLIEFQLEQTGTVVNENVKGVVKQLIGAANFLYFPQRVTEYAIQFTMLYSMMKSHRVVGDKIMSFFDYKSRIRNEVIDQFLTDEQKADLQKYIEYQTKKEENPQFEHDYIGNWIRKEFFQGRISRDDLGKFRAQYNSRVKLARQEFDKYDSVYANFELTDGLAELKAGSKISNFQLALFEEKIKAVNQSLHGVYNTINANMLQQVVWGNALMQFRKWMRPNWNRYFGARFGKAQWSERRQSWNKGIYISYAQFMASPMKAVRDGIPKSQRDKNLLAGFANLVKAYSKFALNTTRVFNTMSEIDKANIMSVHANMAQIALMGSLLFAAGQLDDKDEEQLNFANYLVYQANLFYMDSIQFLPFVGWYATIRRFMQHPFAAEKLAYDLSRFVGALFSYPFQDPDERTYTSGALYGEVKVVDMGKKLIPLYRELYKWENIGIYTNYYKMYNPLDITN